MNKKTKITKEMSVSEVINKYPKTSFVFIDYGLPCVGCHMVKDDTVEGASQLHRVDLKRLLADLNKAAK